MSTRAASQQHASTDRIVLIAVTLLGMALCAPGVGLVATTGAWLTFQGITGTALGVIVLAIVGMRLLGRTLPMIGSDRAAIVAIVAIGLVKFAIAALLPLQG